MPSRPNLIVVLCDQLRRSALACYGDPNARTPNLDRLAEQGAFFRNACATYPICVPYRFSLMTGQYPHTRMIPGIAWRMSPAERTLADEFNEAGYETMYVGKWHLYGGQCHMPGYSAQREGCLPVPRRFQGRWQHWRGFELRNSHFDTRYFVDDDPTPHKIEGYQTDGLFDLTMALIEEKRPPDRPFACVLSVEPPHPPHEAPRELEAAWEQAQLEVPDNFMCEDDDPFRERMVAKDVRDREAVMSFMATYYAMIENLDNNMGCLLEFLDREGLTDSTHVMFTSDHGELLGSHTLLTKQFPYEEACGVPLFMRGPGITKQTVDAPIATEDLFPTLLGLCDIKPRDDVPGTSFAPCLRSETAPPDRLGVLLEFVSETRPNQSLHKCCYRGIRSKRFKYTVAGDLTGFSPWQFFDLEQDPYEMHNLISEPQWQETIARHHAFLRQRLIDTDDDAPLTPAFGCPGLGRIEDTEGA